MCNLLASDVSGSFSLNQKNQVRLQLHIRFHFFQVWKRVPVQHGYEICIWSCSWIPFKRRDLYNALTRLRSEPATLSSKCTKEETHTFATRATAVLDVSVAGGRRVQEQRETRGDTQTLSAGGLDRPHSTEVQNPSFICSRRDRWWIQGVECAIPRSKTGAFFSSSH